MQGKRFCWAISCARKCFLTVTGVVSAALHGGVVAHNHAVDARHAANAGNDPGTGRAVGPVAVGVHAHRRQRREFEEGRSGVQQVVHAVTRQQLATGRVFGAGGVTATHGGLVGLGVQVGDQRTHGVGVGDEIA
jgi:hypothetical protein